MKLSNAPSITMPRSAWKQHPLHCTSWKHAQLVPIDCFEVVAGDTFKCDLDYLVRMNTPIAPFMQDIECEINYFFVPFRLLWTHFEEFFGANKDSAGPQTTEYEIPSVSLYTRGNAWNSVSRYLGKPTCSLNASKASAGYGKVSILKERAYYFIWSEFYRASAIQDPFIMNTSDSGVIGSIGMSPVLMNDDLLNVNKNLDLFTCALTSPQYGDSITVGMAGTAPLKFIDAAYSMTGGQGGYPLRFYSDEGRFDTDGPFAYRGSAYSGNVASIDAGYADGDEGGYVSIDGMNVVADLSEATATTINQLRYAFACQRFLEQSNYGGSFYWSQLMAHYGVTPADSSLQRPQRLGTYNFLINVSQVTAMADTTIEGSVKPAGSTGAVSVSGGVNVHLFTKAFQEPGYVMALLHTRIKKQTYSQGLLKEDIKFSRFEFYTPELANLGDMPILNKQIYLQGAAADDKVFGYNESFYEYRYRSDSVSGVLDPAAGAGVAVGFWTLANNFGSLPILNNDFLVESRSNVASRLTTGTASLYDYIGEFKFHYTAVREMSVHSNPGLIDHLGDR